MSSYKKEGFRNEINEAVKARESIIKEFEKIGNIQLSDFNSNKKILDPFLGSDNDEIRNRAEEKKRYLEQGIEELANKEISKEEEKKDTFKRSLKEKEAAYQNYENLINSGFETEAEDYKKSLNLKYNSYQEYLSKKLESASTNQERIKYLEAGGEVSRKRVTGVKATASGIDEKIFEPIDTTSINALRDKLKTITEEFYATQDTGRREELRKEKDALAKKIDLAENGSKEEKGIYQDITRELSSLSVRQLIEYRKYWKDRAKTAKKGSEELLDAENKVAAATRQTLETIANEASGVFSEASSLFSKFGDEDTAQLMDQLSGVASGAARIAAGDIIGGSLQVLNSAISVEVVSDTAKFEEAIKDLEKVSLQISNNIKNTVGVNQAKEKLNYQESIRDKEKQLANAEQAEREARKEVKVLGVKVGSKGKGSGTDQAKIEEFQAQAAAAKQELIELKEEYDSFITGTTRDTLADSIFEGLKEGKRGIVDFAETFEKLIGDSVLNTFKREKLAQISKEFLDSFGSATDSNNDGEADLTKEEIAKLRDQFNENIKKATDDFEAVEVFLKDAGIDLGDSAEQSGLSGSVKREISEETGTAIEGLMRGQHDNVKRLLVLAEQEANISISNNGILIESSKHLEDISNNTANTVIELKLAVAELKEINDKTQPLNTRDLGI